LPSVDARLTRQQFLENLPDVLRPVAVLTSRIIWIEFSAVFYM